MGLATSRLSVLPAADESRSKRPWRFGMWTAFDGWRNCTTNFPEVRRGDVLTLGSKEIHDSTSRPVLDPSTLCVGRRARCEALGTRCTAGGPARWLRVVVARVEFVRSNYWWCSVANGKRGCGDWRGGRRVWRWSAGRIRTLERCGRQLGRSRGGWQRWPFWRRCGRCRRQRGDCRRQCRGRWLERSRGGRGTEWRSAVMRRFEVPHL
jgi:hypothetical protein